eukprot:SAG31_NODE_5211_length_2673_cov_3.479409_3_plen_72_part_00
MFSGADGQYVPDRALQPHLISLLGLCGTCSVVLADLSRRMTKVQKNDQKEFVVALTGSIVSATIVERRDYQ